MRDRVMEFTDAYNSLWGALSSLTVAGKDGAAGGLLASASSIRDMKNMLNKLTSTQLDASGPYTTLAQIGVHTNKARKTEVDTEALAAALQANAAADKAMSARRRVEQEWVGACRSG